MQTNSADTLVAWASDLQTVRRYISVLGDTPSVVLCADSPNTQVQKGARDVYFSFPFFFLLLHLQVGCKGLQTNILRAHYKSVIKEIAQGIQDESGKKAKKKKNQ